MLKFKKVTPNAHYLETSEGTLYFSYDTLIAYQGISRKTNTFVKLQTKDGLTDSATTRKHKSKMNITTQEFQVVSQSELNEHTPVF
jgi:hypothetical protein